MEDSVHSNVIALIVTDACCASAYLFNKEGCLWLFARTRALNHACLPASLRESITAAACRRRHEAGEPTKKCKKRGKHNNGEAI